MNAERHATETRDTLTAGYTTDLHPLGDLMPLVRTRAETPYTALDVDRSDPALPARLDDLLDEINKVRNHREESP